jgi:hypothetical protein
MLSYRSGLQRGVIWSASRFAVIEFCCPAQERRPSAPNQNVCPRKLTFIKQVNIDSFNACKACLAMRFWCVRAPVGTVESVTVLEFSVLNNNPYTSAKPALYHCRVVIVKLSRNFMCHLRHPLVESKMRPTEKPNLPIWRVATREASCMPCWNFSPDLPNLD